MQSRWERDQNDPGRLHAFRCAASRRSPGRRMLSFYGAAPIHAARQRRSGSRSLRLRGLFLPRPIGGSLGLRILEQRAPAMDSDRRADRRLPKGHVQAPVRSARRSARPISGGGRGVGALPRGRSRSPTIRRFRYARPYRGRAEPGPRLRGPEQHGNASVGRLGSDAPRRRLHPAPISSFSTASPRSRANLISGSTRLRGNTARTTAYACLRPSSTGCSGKTRQCEQTVAATPATPSS